MRTTRRTMGLAAACLAVLAMADAQASEAKAAAAGATAAKGADATPQVPAVDPAALAALEKMGGTLRGLQRFSVRSDAEIEVVLDSGQKIELDQAIQYRVHKPGHLRVDMKGANFERQVFFNDGQLTIWAPQKKYYAAVATQAKTLPELVANAASQYGLELPLTDLFLWGTDAAPLSDITAAFKVGEGLVDGERVDHWALREQGIDWQVWISQATSLPRKLVITGLDDPSQPEFTAQLHWDTKSPIAGDAFVFQPPADAAKIALAPVAGVVLFDEEK